MSVFFPLPRGDGWYLAGLLLFVAVSFLPWTRGVQVGGLSLFGWLMAALMVLSPAVALARFVLAADEGEGGRHQRTGHGSSPAARRVDRGDVR